MADANENRQRAMYGAGYSDGHARRDPQENPVEPEWYASGYDAGFKASMGITAAEVRERGGSATVVECFNCGSLTERPVEILRLTDRGEEETRQYCRFCAEREGHLKPGAGD